MSRYFDINLPEKPEIIKPPSTKKLRIKKRNQIRTQNRNLQATLKICSGNTKKNTKPEREPVDANRIKFYGRGEGLQDVKLVKGKYFQRKLENKEKKIEWASEQSARTEVLLTEESGFLVADDGERTSGIKQSELAKSVDLTSATKHFNLNLDFGIYQAKFTPNGRHLLLGGRKGHIAAFDWVTKRLHCEMNVMEEVFDVQWLRFETWFAVAQKKWVYIYDNTGIELHCLKKIFKPLKLEFLPYHFLLTSASEEGYLTWLDVSVGAIVSQFNTKLGRLSIMTQNPYNGIICTGHSKGIVAMWSPNSKEPVAKMLCHKTALTAVTVDPKGLFMATSGVDRTMNIWDVRNLRGPMQKYNLHSVVTSMSFSQKTNLAMAMGNVVEIYNDCCISAAEYPYLRHRVFSTVGNVQFCPFEDVLGIGHQDGYTSILVPGSGEPNIDAFENNPFQSKKQRREAEVKALLEKIPSEMISMDPFEILDVHVPILKEKVEARNTLQFLKPQKIDFTPRRKKRKINIARVKQIVQEENKKEFIRQKNSVLKSEQSKRENEVAGPIEVLDRFKVKKKR